MSGRAAALALVPQATGSRISSYTEWDPLEELILGDPLGAQAPGDFRVLDAVIPPRFKPLVAELVPELTGAYPDELIAAARRDLVEFRHVLEGEGVRVHTAQPPNWDRPLSTPDWAVESGFCSSNPRDSLLVIGDTLIEAPMCDRSRYFETFAYRPALQKLFDEGARWVAAPKPRLLDGGYRDPLPRDAEGVPTGWLIREDEPLFDGADFIRFGRDVLVTLSHTTNEAGVRWVERLMGDAYRFHRLETKNPYAMHIDDTLMPIAPGKLIYSPDYLDPAKLPEMFKSWDVRPAPRPRYTPANVLGELSGWLNINMLSLDGDRIIVEREQTDTIAMLEAWGMTPIPVAFEGYYPFIGSFHCATLDTRRAGELASYF